jgi:catechol 2,3-dioxygenase-like lactoylglutathione lyase family enzyme
MSAGDLDGVGLSVNDMEAMVRFYVDGLGCTVGDAVDLPDAITAQLRVVPSGTEMTVLLPPRGPKLKLVRVAGQVAPSVPTPSITARTGGTYLTFQVADVPGTRDALVALGGTALSDPSLEKAAAFVADPEGNLVELLRPPRPA